MNTTDALSNLKTNLDRQRDSPVFVPREALETIVRAYESIAYPSEYIGAIGSSKVYVLRGGALLVDGEYVSFPELPAGCSAEFAAAYYRRIADDIERVAVIAKAKR